MNVNYKAKMAKAIAADKAKYGTIFDAKLPLEFKRARYAKDYGELDVNDLFEEEAVYKYHKNLGKLYGTSLSAADLSEGATNPKELMESIAKAVETVVGTPGVEAKISVEDMAVNAQDNIDIHIKTQTGDGNNDYVTSLSLKDRNPAAYQSHREFIDAVREWQNQMREEQNQIRHENEIQELKKNGHVISANAQNVFTCAINLEDNDFVPDLSATKDFLPEDYDRLSYIMDRCVDAFSPDMAHGYEDIVSHIKKRIEEVNQTLDKPFTAPELDAITLEKENVYINGHPNITVLKDGKEFGSLMITLYVNEEYCGPNHTALLPGEQITSSYFGVSWDALDALAKTVQKECGKSDDFTNALESILKTDDKRMQMAKALLADKMKADYEFDTDLEWGIKDVSNIEDRFAGDEKFKDTMMQKISYQTLDSLNSIHWIGLDIPEDDFNPYYPLIDSLDLADILEHCVNNVDGMDWNAEHMPLESKIKIVGNDVVASYFAKAGEHVCDATLTMENLQPDVYQSHKLFMDWMKESVTAKNQLYAEEKERCKYVIPLDETLHVHCNQIRISRNLDTQFSFSNSQQLKDIMKAVDGYDAAIDMGNCYEDTLSHVKERISKENPALKESGFLDDISVKEGNKTDLIFYKGDIPFGRCSTTISIEEEKYRNNEYKDSVLPKIYDTYSDTYRASDINGDQDWLFYRRLSEDVKEVRAVMAEKDSENSFTKAVEGISGPKDPGMEQ